LSSQAKQDGVYEIDYLITSLPLKAGQFYCFSFWHFFFGIELHSSIGLYASKQSKAASNPKQDPDYTALWFSSLPISRNWNQHFVEIPMQQHDFYLVFVGRVSRS